MKDPYWAVFLLIAAGAAFLSFAQAASNGLSPVPRRMLCITEGEISENGENQFSVHTPKMRGYVNGATIPEAEVRFTYLGSTERDVPLGSGEMRRQFGLKVSAEDPCNLIYVMWRFEPVSKIVVSLKSNPGQHASSDCGNRGYHNMKPARAWAVPHLGTGSTHTLRAVLRGEEMSVLVDGALVWVGPVGREALGLRGPVGVRSDNARLSFQLLTHDPGEGFAKSSPGCKRDTGE